MNKLGFVLCILATACVRNGGEDNGGFSNAEAKSAGDALGTGVEASAKTFGPMDGMANADGPPCVTITGDPSDADLDNIPVSGTINYACTSTALGLTGMLTGTIAITDDEPNTAAWHFTGTANLHASLTATNGASIMYDRDGSLIASQATPLGPFSLAHDLDTVTMFRTGGDLGAPRTTTVTEAAGWTLTFTPMATWSPGGLVITGSLAATGDWTVTVESETATATATATLGTPTALTLDPACETRITAGVLVATYPIEGGGTGTVTVTWTGCGQRTVTNS